MNKKEIINRAYELQDYVYWYGGKGQTCTTTLLNSLASSYPSVYTDSYIAKCKKDIDGSTKCGDCSFLVCYSYDINQIGSSQIKEKYSTYTGTAKPGMIGWKSGHVGIYDEDLNIIEMRGVDYDWTNSRTASSCGFTAVLYDPDVDYDYCYSVGWHHDGVGWWYAYGTSSGSYYKSGIYYLPCADGNYYYFAFDDDGYMVTDTGKLNITDFGNIEVKK